MTTSANVQTTPTKGLDPNTWLQWAQYYASLGFAMLPLAGKDPAPRPDGRRKPDGEPIRLGAYDASADPAQWRAWVAYYGTCNIGIAIPQGKIAIDVDPRHEGDVDFEALERAHGETFNLRTFAQKTGGGGWHFVYDAPHGQRYPGGKLEGRKGLDVKQHGGYLVAAPSVHPDTGKCYELAGFPVFAKPPGWVRFADVSESRVTRDSSHDTRLDNLRFGMDPAKAIADVSDDAIARAVQAVASIYVPGQRHHVRVKMGALLNRRGWSRESVERFGRALCTTYGGDNENKIARETVMGMGYPSGYFELIEMVPHENRETFAAQLDALTNPFGDEYRATNARAAAEFRAAFGQPNAANGERPAATSDIDDRVARGRALKAAWRVTTPREPIKPLIDGIPVADGITTFIVGAPNAGKTPLALLLATSIATGKPLLGRATTQRPVVLLAFEKSHEGSPKLWRVAKGLNVDVAATEGLSFVEADRQGLHLDDGKGKTRGEVADLVAAIHADTGLAPVVIVDTYSSSVNGLKPNDGEYAAPMRDFENALRAVAPCAVVHLVHTRKDVAGRLTLADIGGTGQLAAVCSAAIGLDRANPEDKTRLRLCVLRGETSDSRDIEFRWSDPSGDEGPLVAEVIDTFPNGETGETFRGTRSAKRETRADLEDAAQAQLERALDSMQDGESLTMTELRQRGSVSKTARYMNPFDARVRVAVKDGRLSTTPNGRGSYRYQRRRQVGEMPAPHGGGFPATHVQPPGAPPLLTFYNHFDSISLPGTLTTPDAPPPNGNSKP